MTFAISETLGDCSEDKGDGAFLVVVTMLMLSAAIGGFSNAIYFTLGPVYVDDNVKKSKAPLLLVLANFVRLLGPAVGYSLASFCLKFYVSPELHPKINDEDPRWIGAWWLGYGVFAIVLFFFAPIISAFPKTLPRAALRRKNEILKETENNENERSSKSSVKGDCLAFFVELLE